MIDAKIETKIDARHASIDPAFGLDPHRHPCENVRQTAANVTAAIADGSMVHELTSHSWLMVPVFALATATVLWWRRGVIAVTAVALAVMLLHDLLSGKQPDSVVLAPELVVRASSGGRR